MGEKTHRDISCIPMDSDPALTPSKKGLIAYSLSLFVHVEGGAETVACFSEGAMKICGAVTGGPS